MLTGTGAERLGRKSRAFGPFGPTRQSRGRNSVACAGCIRGAAGRLNRPPRRGNPGALGREMAVRGQDKTRAVELAARLLGRDDPESRQALGGLWDVAFDEGRLAALDELQDRFCVCMK